MNILAILNSKDCRSFLEQKAFLPRKTYNIGHLYGYLLIKVIKQGVLKIIWHHDVILPFEDKVRHEV